jgi:hypothetical protein
MGLREFRDSEGVVWKVWDVTPDWLDRRTLAEDYMRDWQDGWLCFESSESRRRLAKYPSKWEDANDAELERLLGQAQDVRRRAPGEISGEFLGPPGVPGSPTPSSGVEVPAAPADVERPMHPSAGESGRMTPAGGVSPERTRTFKDSTGRAFTAALYRIAGGRELQEGGIPTSPGTVLRFVSGSVVLDLEKWPDDWERQTDAQLAELLSRAQPPHDESAITDSLPLRRRTDLPG